MPLVSGVGFMGSSWGLRDAPLGCGVVFSGSVALVVPLGELWGIN